MRRYYALLLVKGGLVRLVKAKDGESVLAEMDFPWEVDRQYGLRLCLKGTRIRAWVDGVMLFEVEDKNRPLKGGAAAFVLEEGHMMSECMVVAPVSGMDDC
jgi:hypothetical protein